jgi:hypothetical protein
MEPTLHLPLLRIAVTAVITGILGGSTMPAAMRLITGAEWARHDMIVAVGSLFTRTRENAFQTGAVIHTFSATGFALPYSAIMWKLGLNPMPTAPFAGILFGIIHGMIGQPSPRLDRRGAAYA